MKPNILFIISDQHNAKYLGTADHLYVKTPNLDKLAEDGVRFNAAICQNTICTPSRISYLSGQYCHNHGYYGLSGRNPKGLTNILGHFRKSGYATAAIGKIHCPDNWVENDCDYHREAYWYSRETDNSDYHEYLKSKNLTGSRDDEVLPESNSGQGLDARRSNLKYEDSVEGWCVKEADKFIDSCGEKPFIMQVSLPRPHQCYTPSEPFWSMYDEDKITLPPNADYDMSLKPPHFQRVRKEQEKGEWTLFKPEDYYAGRKRVLKGYLGNVSQVDYAVGQLMDVLKEKGIEDNTIVIYTSDHGDFAGEHGIIEKAPGIGSDAITRVPCIWRWPDRFKKGHVCDEIVEAVDLSTTIASLAGLPEMPTSDGKDMTPLLQGENKQLHRIGVTECPFSKSVRKGKWHMVHYPPEVFKQEMPGKEIGELYNLEEDPWEKNNLFYKDEFHTIVMELRKDLLNWLITSTRPVSIWPPAEFSDQERDDDNITTSREYFITSSLTFSHYYESDGKISPSRIKKIATEGNSTMGGKNNYI